MKPVLFHSHYDLITPDAKITEITHMPNGEAFAEVEIHNISPSFVGFEIEPSLVFFNIKSTLAQIGIHSFDIEKELSLKLRYAKASIRLIGIGEHGKRLLSLLSPGAYIGKLFAADPRRKVRDPHYLSRMFGRSDRSGRPLLTLGGLHGSDDLVLEKINGRAVAFLSLKPGTYEYDSSVTGLLPTIAKALHYPSIETRKLLKVVQVPREGIERKVSAENLLLVKTIPLHIRTVFARVVDELLPKGFHHTSASVLQPDTDASGDIYELFGNSSTEIVDIPLEFYTLEPFREHVFFEDRDQLQTAISSPKALFSAFETAPTPETIKCATFIVKGEQLKNLSTDQWHVQDVTPSELPGFFHPTRQALIVQHYIDKQPSYPYLKAIEEGTITSQGILLTRFFPSPLMKRHLISEQVLRNLKGIYFLEPSSTHGEFFSHEDRSFLSDLSKFGIPLFWLDRKGEKILQYVPKPGKDSGMFVPIEKVETFLNATMVGIYGSNLLEGNFEETLKSILQGLLEMKSHVNHELLSPKTPLAMVTGGGPGVMSVGNKVAKELGILSCANIVDFSLNKGLVVNEQHQNPYIEAKMTFRLDRLVERQAEFHLDLAIFLMGGIGTDFEYSLEEVRRKVGSCKSNPILLIGPPEYWREKITSRFQNNLKHGTIKGSEWVSNCFFCVQNAQEALSVYKAFFTGTLSIGSKGPVYKNGFRVVAEERL